MKIFLIMSFDSEFDEIYKFIKKIVESPEDKVFRADDLLHQQNILKDIVTCIYESDLIIADLTGSNSNVFYELGLAHALQKNVILLIQDIDELPFDLRSYRVIEYSTHFSKIGALEEKLKKMICDTKSNSIHFGNPISDWLHPRQIIKEEDSSTPALNNIQVFDPAFTISDLGIIDLFADLEETLDKLNVLIVDYSKITNEIGSITRRDALKIQTASQNPSQGTMSYIRKITKKTAESMNQYAESTQKYNVQFEELWNTYEDRIFRLLSSDLVVKNHNELLAFSTFIKSQLFLKENIVVSKEAISSFIESVVNLKGMQKDVTRASNFIEIELKIFVGLLEKAVSTIDRLTQIANEMIEKFQSKYGNI